MDLLQPEFGEGSPPELRSESAAHAESGAAGQLSARPVCRGRLLIVEDERHIREALVDLLKDEGYEIETAENGRVALDRLAAGSAPDLILLDLRMPVMNGWEFRAAQRKDPRLSTIPVVAVSADGSAQAVAIHADAYLRKPLDTNALLGTIERILLLSERRQMAARLEEAERLASLGRLAAGVGHEINNPLAFVTMNVSLMAEQMRRLHGEAEALGQVSLGTDRLDETLDLLEDCRIGLERIRGVVDSLQSLSRKSEGPLAQVDLVKLLDQSISLAGNQLRQRASVRRDYGEAPPVLGHAAKLGQVFVNLLVNAAQAIPEGHVLANEVRVTARADGELVIIEVSDTGAGIPPDILPRIFDPFFTTKPVGSGTGLGLSICQRIVSDHGGRLEIDSEVGRGTIVRVSLPCAPQAGAEADAPGQAAQEVRRARVLVIDDEPLIQKTVRIALARHYDVVTLGSGEEAIGRLAAGERFDLILCDLAMPGSGGPEVRRAVATHAPELLPRLLFMTGGAFTPATDAFVQETSHTVLRKPFALADLERLVRERIDAGPSSVG